VPLGISLIDSILRRPLFPEQTLNEWKLKNQTLSTNYWQVALWPQTPKVSDLRKTDLRDAFIRYFRPENTFIALGGNFPVEIPDKLQARFSDWIMPRAVPAPTDLNRWKNTLSNSTATSTVEFFGKEIRLADADFPSRLLAVFALGVGKGSTLFQVPRESLALSYRQELLLWPTVKGFRTRMIMAFSNPDFVPQQAEEIRSEMLKSVNSWTEADRVRAIGAAEGLFVYGIGVSPFAVTGQTTMGESLERDTFLRAFWFSKSGKDWNPFSYFDTLRLVDLPTLKETANDLLGKSEAKVILGLQGRS
jgi:hypothetical protein